MTYRYTGFGLSIGSDLPLPELPSDPSPGGSADVRIDLGPSSSATDRENGEAHWSVAHAGSATLGWAGVGTYRVTADIIVVEPDPEVSPERLRLFLLGAALGTLLHLRGRLVLHGSSVARGRRAGVFLAPKGGGKSTMAATLVSRGARLLSDDVVAIDSQEDRLVVRPSFGQLKLWPDALSVLRLDEDDLPRIHPEFDKRDVRTESDFRTAPEPLAAVFLLKRGPDVRLEPVAPEDAMSAITQHWYTARFGYDVLRRLGMDHLFAATARLVSSTPCFRLWRPPEMALIGETAAIVESVLAPPDDPPVGT